MLYVGTSAGLEAQWLPQSGLRYELFEMHGIRGHNAIERARASAEFVRAIGLALSLVRRFRPDLIVSAGGYASASMARGGDPESHAVGVDGAEHAPGVGRTGSCGGSPAKFALASTDTCCIFQFV